jgi:hypothetical protein
MKTPTGLVMAVLATIFAVITLVKFALTAQASPPPSVKAPPAKNNGAPPAAQAPQAKHQALPPSAQATPGKSQASPPAKTNVAASAKTVDAWSITQWAELYGTQELIVSQIGIKSSNAKSKICLVMTPPFNIVTYYNTRAHSYFQSPVKDFRCPMQKTFALFNAYVLGDSPMEKVGTGTLNGFEVVKYRTTKAFTLKQAASRHNDKVPSSNPMIIDSQSTDDFHLAPGAGLGLCRLYGLPLVPGIPLKVIAKDSDLNPKTYLQSKQGTKTKVNASDFAIPPGYKLLKRIEEITQTAETQDALLLFGK